MIEEQEFRMPFAAICDACRAASVQVMPGALVALPSGPTLRSIGSPEATSCAIVVSLR
ncbi:MAG: hypothetical protein QF664_04015 [Dehalococcoidia bacterium]|jgi:hypothetical protein|nr:hypothetical protein [Dehalococcoidia bacterium]